MPESSASRPSGWLRLAVVGTAAGFFSGLFGVGGGLIIVPLLVLWLAYGEREATGTSLAAIALIALFGVATHAAYGNVDVGHAAALGLPAVAGVLAGTRLQQRVPAEAISLLLAAVLVAVAIDLIVR